MAIIATVNTAYGEKRSLYIRLNNVEISNHGVKTMACFRGFISEEIFKSGKGMFVWERSIEFDSNLDEVLWNQAYQALKDQPFYGFPDEPIAPLPIGSDATDDEKEIHAQAMVEYGLLYSDWEKKCSELEKINEENLSLHLGTDLIDT